LETGPHVQIKCLVSGVIASRLHRLGAWTICLARLRAAEPANTQRNTNRTLAFDGAYP
jgi:hypothetical protein